MADLLLTLLTSPYVTVALAMLLVIGRMALYFRRIMVLKQGFPRRPVLSELSVLIGFLLAVWSLFLSPGWIGGTFALVTALLGGFVLYLFSQGGVPRGIGVKVGAPALAFSAPEGAGGTFDYQPGQNDPLLLKFYRGHW